MGCWNETCALSNLPILAGEDVVFLILTRNPYSENECKTGCGIGDHWFPRTLPVFAKYDDYGSIEGWDPKTEDPVIRTILDGYRTDLYPSRQSLRDQTLKIPPRTKETLSWDNLLQWLGEGLVRVDARARRPERLTREKVDKSLAEIREVKDKFGSDKEPVPVDGSEELKREISRRNSLRDMDTPYNLERWEETILRDAEAPVSLPCVKILIRRDVWDSLLGMEIRPERWSKTSYNFSQFLTVLDIWTKAEAEVLDLGEFSHVSKDEGEGRRFFRRLEVSSVARKMLGDKNEDLNFLLAELSGMSSGGLSGPPFEVCPRDVLKKSPCNRDLLRRYLELRYIEKVMTFIRKAWAPTSGSGSQGEEYEPVMEFHLRCAKLARDLFLERNVEFADDSDEERREVARLKRRVRDTWKKATL